jgi:acetyltransferase-like isoleucine patch superfamily enzyme
MKKYVFAVFGLAKVLIIKLFHWKTIHVKGLVKIASSSIIQSTKKGSISLGNHCSIGNNVEVVSTGGNVVIGSNVHFGNNCMIISRKEITIGDDTIFGPHVYIYDHDHDYNARLNENKYKTGSVKIGNECWIGVNSVILRNTEIGNNCVIGAGSVVHGVIPSYTVLVQKRENTFL